ncbi:MAG: hypothetical protein ABSE82_09500, partial [Nitrososphaerales archaeon]
ASDGNQPISLTVIPANGSSISWMWIKTSLQLRVTVQYAREVGPPITAAGTGSPSGLQFAVTSLYVKNLSPDAMLFNPDLSLLARFAFSNGTDVSRFLGSMQLDASQERNQTDFMLVPSTDTLQNVTIVEAPQQMIYGVNSTQSLAMSNYSSIRVGNVELSYVAEYLASWSGSQCMPQPPSYTNCGNGSAAPGMKWIMVALFVQNLDNDRSVNWPYLNAEFCYGNVCNQQKNMGLGGNLNPGENWGSASTVFQINSTSFLTSVDYLGLLGFSNSTA